jgi:hypothetical protein
VIRTQVQLTERQAAALKHTATRRGVSMAEILRELVDAHLTLDDTRGGARERALRAVGQFRSGRGDVSTRHDRDLADAFEQ